MQQQEFMDWTDALGAMEMQAVRSWRGEYYPREGYDEVLANRIRRLRIEAERLPGGVWLITLTIRARLHWQTEKYFWRMNLVGGTYYVT